MDVSEFICTIKGKYLFYLYENFRYIFPGCCHEASNLLCGYLNYYFDDSFKHKFISDVPRPHSYISNEQGVIIDFTSWQYINNYYGKLDGENEQTLLKKAQQCKGFPIVTSGEIYFYKPISEVKLEQMDNIINVECYCTDGIENYPPDLFEKYCTSDRAEKIQQALHDNKIF
jgi:hypothetical protein